MAKDESKAEEEITERAIEDTPPEIIEQPPSILKTPGYNHETGEFI